MTVELHKHTHLVTGSKRIHFPRPDYELVVYCLSLSILLRDRHCCITRNGGQRHERVSKKAVNDTCHALGAVVEHT